MSTIINALSQTKCNMLRCYGKMTIWSSVMLAAQISGMYFQESTYTSVAQTRTSSACSGCVSSSVWCRFFWWCVDNWDICFWIRTIMELCKESAQNTLSICADECVEGMNSSLLDYHVIIIELAKCVVIVFFIQGLLKFIQMIVGGNLWGMRFLSGAHSNFRRVTWFQLASAPVKMEIHDR